uniref:MD-2-related lipid-recognition domain-containing protein n=1 Tax=Steinernema glaseri TaxID=37863 RepID=A0A1I7ZEB0_9BILA
MTKYQTLLVLAVTALAACGVSAKRFECVDGVNNVIEVVDHTNGKGAIRFRDVKILTYDVKKRPFCHEGGPSVRFPGNLKISSGEIEIAEPLRNSRAPLKLEMSVEKNSFLIGTVCEKGMSKNQFVPSEICNFEICQLLGEDACKMFEETNVLQIADLPPSVSDFIDIGALPLPQLEGEWKVAIELKQKGKTKGSISFGNGENWVNIESAVDGSDNNAHEEL